MRNVELGSFGMFVKWFIVTALIYAVCAVFIVLLWNGIISPVTGVMNITFWQAVGLRLLVEFLTADGGTAK